MLSLLGSGAMPLVPSIRRRHGEQLLVVFLATNAGKCGNFSPVNRTELVFIPQNWMMTRLSEQIISARCNHGLPS